jgi:hypothetical protein
MTFSLGLVFPPEEKCLALRQFILTFLAKASVTARQFSQLLGNVWVEFLDKRIVQVGMNLDRQCVQMSLDNLNNLVKTKGAMANPNGRARN